ncbi:MAG: cytochrome P450 [Chitinophagaceae bacterium]
MVHENILFLQSEVQDPYSFYDRMLLTDPVYFDKQNNIRAIYSYAGCKEIFTNAAACIPDVNPGNKSGLNEYALLISKNLARLNDGTFHEIAKYTASRLFDSRKLISFAELLNGLINASENKKEIDWINTVVKRLPVISVLKSFDFNRSDIDFLTHSIQYIARLIAPGKSADEITGINETAEETYNKIDRHIRSSQFYQPLIDSLQEKYKMSMEDAVCLCVSNFIGLLIQSYDAGRGILSNSLLQILSNNTSNNNYSDKDFIRQSVIESVRFDPPLHNTRRIATEDIMLENTFIKKEELILVVIAAANRDPKQFIHPSKYDISRPNNKEHLTFGMGAHSCLANHYAVNMVTETLFHLFEKYSSIALTNTIIQYEPAINARLPKHLFITLTP